MASTLGVPVPGQFYLARLGNKVEPFLSKPKSSAPNSMHSWRKRPSLEHKQNIGNWTK